MDRLLRKFGLGKGRLDLELTESTVPLGSSIAGTLTYELKKPEEGKELWVEVRATQRVTAPREVTRFRSGKPQREVESLSTVLVLYKYREQLDGYHMYDLGTHDFQLPLPDLVASPFPDMETPNSSWLRRNRFGHQLVRYDRISWQVRAKLVIPWSLGVTDSKRFYVTEAECPRKARPNYCGGCGNRRKARDEFCPNCGRKF